MVTNQLEAEGVYTGSPIWRMMNHMLTQQDVLNQQLIGSDWCLQAVQRQRIDYSAAILEKASELQNFDKSWKWWEPKSAEVDLKEMMRMELVNLLSLLLSEDLSISYEDFHTACAEDPEPKLGHEHVMDMAMGDLAFLLEESYEHAFTNPESKEVAAIDATFNPDYNAEKMRRALHALTASVLQGVNVVSTGFEEGQEDPDFEDEVDGGNEFTSASNVNWTAFWSTAYHLGMTLADVYTLYMSEALLGPFRAHKMKTNAYFTKWQDGQEDQALVMAYYQLHFKTHNEFPSIEEAKAWINATYDELLETL